jgi:hypothetical protein
MRESSSWRQAKNRQSAAMTQENPNQNHDQNDTPPQAGAIIVNTTANAQSIYGSAAAGGE